MPLIGTYGALAQFRDGGPFAIATRTNSLGFEVNINYFPAPTAVGNTYFANSNVGNYNNSSNTNSIFVSNVAPFTNYNWEVIVNTPSGNTSPVQTNTLNLNSNVANNTSYAIPNNVWMDIAPNALQICTISNVNTFTIYNRNANTGTLSTSYVGTIPNVNSLSEVIYSQDGAFLYISGAKPITFNTTIWSVNLANYNIIEQSIGNNYTSYMSLCASSDNKSIIVGTKDSTAAQTLLLNFSRDANTGNLSLYQSPITIATDTRPRIIVSNDNKNLYLTEQTIGPSIRKIYTYDRNVSNTNLVFNNVIDLGSNIEPIFDIECSFDNKNIYLGRSSNITNFSRNLVTGNLTFISNTSGSGNLCLVTNTNIIADNQNFIRNINDGNLTVNPNGIGFITAAGGFTIVAEPSNDNKNIYLLRNDSLANIATAKIYVYNITS